MGRLIRACCTAVLLLAVALPLIPLVVWSFARSWFFPALWPPAWSLDAWRYVLSPSSQVLRATVMSGVVAAAVVVLSGVLGLPAARALALERFRGRTVFLWIVLLPLIVPNLVAAMGMHIVFIRVGLADTLPGVVLVHLVPALPYFILVMAGYLAGYSTELEETACSLGAGPLRTFWWVTLPAIWPGLAVAALFTFLVSWTQYITTVLIGGGQIITLPMVLFPLVNAANHAEAAAVSLVFLAPALLVLALTAHVLGRGTAAGRGMGEW